MALPAPFPAAGYVPLGSGVGLASSPNVPAPGTSINPATGKPHTAGLTRAELEAQRAASAKGKEKDVSELSGRAQAARQLAGGGANVPETSSTTETAKTTPSPAMGGNSTGPNSASEVFDNVADSLERLGSRAYNFLPSLVKESLSTDPSPPKAPGVSDERRPGIIDQARDRGNKLLLQVEDQVATTRKSLDVPGGVIHQVKGFLGEISAAVVPPAADVQAKTSTSSIPAPTAHTTQSLPSRENQGMLPGESSAGAGALPGSRNEPGVAMLPDEKAAEGTGGGHYTSTEIESLTAGVASMTAASDRASATKNNTVIEGSTATNNTTGTGKTTSTDNTTAPATEQAAAVTQGAPSNEQSSKPATAAPHFSRSFSAGATPSLGALAPALPQTRVGTGAARGATDLEILPENGVPIEHTSRPATAAQTSGPRISADQTDSLASVTAIRGGHEGSRTGNAAATGVSDAVPSTGSPLRNATNSGPTTSQTLTSTQAPGNVEDAVGHPFTRNTEGTSRAPGSYPKVNHSALPPEPTATSKSTTAKDSATPIGSTATGNSAVSHASPASTGRHQHGHERTSSGGEEGKKHVGFMGKLKAVAGKLH